MSAAPAAGPLSAAELAILDAFTERLIPSDETGPGAREAQVPRYIEQALQTAYATSVDEYRRGLAATERCARSRFGRGFVALAEAEQDAVLTTIEADASAFFARVRQHTIEGMFGDPAWGGNAGRVGWTLVGYRGPQAVWTAAEQAIEPIVPSTAIPT